MGNVISQKVLPLSMKVQRTMTVEKVMQQLKDRTKQCPYPSTFDFGFFKSMLRLPNEGWYLKNDKSKLAVQGFQKSLPVVLGEDINDDPIWLTATICEYTWLIEFIAPSVKDIVNALHSCRKHPQGKTPLEVVFLWHWQGCIDDGRHWSEIYHAGNETKIIMQCLIIQHKIVIVMSRELKHKINMCTNNTDYLLCMMQNRDRLEYVM